MLDFLKLGDGWQTVEMATGKFKYAGSLPLVYRDPLSIVTEQYKHLCSRPAASPWYDQAYTVVVNGILRTSHPMSGLWANNMQTFLRKVLILRNH